MRNFMSLVTLLTLLNVISNLVVAQEKDEDLKRLFKKLDEGQAPKWTYSQLTEKADVVVVAKLESKSVVKMDNEIGGTFANDSMQLVKNRLKVMSVFKGDVKGVIDVYTLAIKSNALVTVNFDFAKFRTKQLMPLNVPVIIDGEITGYAEILEGEKTYVAEPEYLLFLRKSAK